MNTKTILLLILLMSIHGTASSQTLRNSSGNRIGKIESDGTIRNSSGNSMGKIESDGTVRNASGKSIGKVEANGTVRDDYGNSIGKANSCNRQRVGAVYFFFSLNDFITHLNF